MNARGRRRRRSEGNADLYRELVNEDFKRTPPAARAGRGAPGRLGGEDPRKGSSSAGPAKANRKGCAVTALAVGAGLASLVAAWKGVA